MKSVRIFIVFLMAVFMALPVAADTKSSDECPRYFAGTVEISSTQMAFIISAQKGGGVLEFEGSEHEFSIGGLGVGGVGVQTINAVGVVYNLENLEDFSGAYGQARAGITVGKGKGAITLSNPQCVVIELKSSTEGVALSVGVDGMNIKLK